MKGIKIESEHKRTVKFIKHYYKQHHALPSDRIIFKKIAIDHLREDPNYYKKLKMAKL